MSIVYDKQNNILRLKDDDANFFKKDCTQVLHLFCTAAQLGASLDIALFESAAAAMPCVAQLPPDVLEGAVDTLLMTAHPDAIAPLIAAGALQPLGLCQAQQCLSVLASAPRNLPQRRKLLWQLCGALPLAVTLPQLHAQGVRGKKAAWVYAQLVSTVQKSPQLNTPQVLVALAKQLAKTR